MVNLDIKRLDSALDKSLETYQLYTGLVFEKSGPLVPTPEKPNTARSTATVRTKGGLQLGTMYNIVFSPGDGTGDQKTYKLGQLEIPEHLKFTEKQERVLPRKKDIEACWAEVILPFCSVAGGRVYPNMMSLDELTVDSVTAPRTIVRSRVLGLSKDIYGKLISDGTDLHIRPSHKYTVGFSEGKRFGDPHAIYHDRNLDSLQLVGFISMPKESPLNDLIAMLDI